jgi:hypothetical protein
VPGRQVGELIPSNERWQAPLRVRSAHVSGLSQAYRPPLAIELIEALGDYSTRRSLSLTFDGKRANPKKEVWLDRMRRVDTELEPTVKWLAN